MNTVSHETDVAAQDALDVIRDGACRDQKHLVLKATPSALAKAIAAADPNELAEALASAVLIYARDSAPAELPDLPTRDEWIDALNEDGQLARSRLHRLCALTEQLDDPDVNAAVARLNAACDAIAEAFEAVDLDLDDND
jgi:hypothetical protein